MRASAKFYHIAAIALLATALPGCASIESLFQGNPPPKQHAHAKHAKSTQTAKNTKTYQPDQFVLQLTLAQLGLSALAEDTSMIAANLDVLQNYSAVQPATPQRQPVVVLTLQMDNAAPEQIVAPVQLPTQTASFPALLGIMNHLAIAPYRLQDISLGTVTVAPPEALSLSDAPVVQVQQTLVQQQQLLLDSMEKSAPLDEVKNQLLLIRFFITHHFRQAAYLSVDNTKRLLATTTPEQPGDDDTIKNLSRQLDALEGQLRKTMPYTLTN